MQSVAFSAVYGKSKANGTIHSRTENDMIEKTKRTSGADEQTPSVPQYFSWINNTNEGATEEQTLVNLEYFKWLRERYGMRLKIYAWDAGNLDGASGTYGDPDKTPKLRKQYPRGYAPLAEKAAEFGCRLGVWGGADGFGDTPEEEKNRYDLIVRLCRELGFMLFKFDTVCGALREEKRTIFKKMIDECREYVPELIVLNHRNDLGDAEICATTFLWGGQETYIDVHLHNAVTGSHHRVCTLERGLVPGMKRLTEDHGVCLSSCMDFFEDDLILQAFARSLILAPEIYGNPWLLRDSEQERLARIYNLHWKYRDILVNGAALPEAYGKNAVSRGDEATRLLTMNNASWTRTTVKISVSEEIGLKRPGKYVVKTLHPYESLVGIYEYGEETEIVVEPFRAALVLVQEKSVFEKTDFVLTNCVYETVTDGKGNPSRLHIYGGNGKKIEGIGDPSAASLISEIQTGVVGDRTLQAPVFLGEAASCALPENVEQLYEATCFRADCDSFEAQSRKRAGETRIPQVKAARDAFFGQETYRFRGCESSAAFSDDRDSFFDGESVFFRTRLNGGCLRVDFGKICSVDRVEIEYFEIDEPIKEVAKPFVGKRAEYSVELGVWNNAELLRVENTETGVRAPVVKDSVHNIEYVNGARRTAVYDVGGEMRYFRLDRPMDRIYAIRLYDAEGKRIVPENPTANNLLSPYANKRFRQAKRVIVTIPEDAQPGCYLAAAIDGEHGAEGAYCGAVCDGAPIGFTDRAASYPINNWEYITGACDSGYTYYLTIDDAMRGEEVAVYFLLETERDIPCRVWLCDAVDKTPLLSVGESIS